VLLENLSAARGSRSLVVLRGTFERGKNQRTRKRRHADEFMAGLCAAAIGRTSMLVDDSRHESVNWSIQK
jgi:hypothetical protein